MEGFKITEDNFELDSELNRASGLMRLEGDVVTLLYMSEGRQWCSAQAGV